MRLCVAVLARNGWVFSNIRHISSIKGIPYRALVSYGGGKSLEGRNKNRSRRKLLDEGEEGVCGCTMNLNQEILLA